MESLRVTPVQTDLIWENPGGNRAAIEEKLWKLAGKTDLIALPETFTTGFTMNNKPNAETMNLHTHKWMRQMAAMTGAAITGSLTIKENEEYYNRLLWIEPSGKEYSYDKKHLFRMHKETEHFTAGHTRLVIHYKGWKICPLICYDLRFPVFARNHYHEEKGLDYDILLYVANWPAVRTEAWDTLLKARAIENHAYCMGVNRIGKDDNEIDYCGHSGIYGPRGETIHFSSSLEETPVITLSSEKLQEYREKFPAYLDGL